MKRLNIVDSKNIIFYLKLESNLSSQSMYEYFWLDKNRSPLSCISDDSKWVANWFKKFQTNLENWMVEFDFFFIQTLLIRSIPENPCGIKGLFFPFATSLFRIRSTSLRFLKSWSLWYVELKAFSINGTIEAIFKIFLPIVLRCKIRRL